AHQERNACEGGGGADPARTQPGEARPAGACAADEVRIDLRVDGPQAPQLIATPPGDGEPQECSPMAGALGEPCIERGPFLRCPVRVESYQPDGSLFLDLIRARHSVSCAGAAGRRAKPDATPAANRRGPARSGARPWSGV